MRRGDVVRVELDPVAGDEVDCWRLAIVVTNDGANRAASATGRGSVAIVPLTRGVTAPHPFQVGVPAGTAGLAEEGTARVEQLRAVHVARVRDVVGHLPPDLLDALDRAIVLHLGL